MELHTGFTDAHGFVIDVTELRALGESRLTIKVWQVLDESRGQRLGQSLIHSLVDHVTAGISDGTELSVFGNNTDLVSVMG